MREGLKEDEQEVSRLFKKEIVAALNTIRRGFHITVNVLDVMFHSLNMCGHFHYQIVRKWFNRIPDNFLYVVLYLTIHLYSFSTIILYNISTHLFFFKIFIKFVK